MTGHALRTSLVSIVVALALAVPAVAGAATRTVTKTADVGTTCTPLDCSLRGAFATVADGDTIIVPAGTYKAATTGGNGVFHVSGHTFTLIGAGAGKTIIDGNGLGRTFAFYAKATVRGVTVTGGTAPTAGCSCGGGFEVRQGGQLTLVDSVVEGNTAPSGGGGISVDSQSWAALRNVTVRQNTSPGDGAGIRVEPGNALTGRLTMTNVTISGNVTTGTGDGGGLANRGNVRGTNVTFAGNRAAGEGGAIVQNGGSTTLEGATLAGNVAGAAGTGIFKASGTIDVHNTILADTGASACAASVLPRIQSGGHNIAVSSSCELTGPGDLPQTDPQLGPFGDNGGPLQTLVPATTSPALDAGDNAGCLATDARGLPRPFGPLCDIGAVEVQSAKTLPPGESPVVPPGTDVPTPPAQAPPVGGQSQPQRARITLLAQRVRVDGRGRGVIRARCAAASGDRCRVRLTLTVRTRVRTTKGTRLRTIRTGTITGTLRAGGTGRLSLRLTKAGRARLSTTGLKLAARGTTTGVAGQATTMSARSVRVLPRRS